MTRRRRAWALALPVAAAVLTASCAAAAGPVGFRVEAPARPPPAVGTLEAVGDADFQGIVAGLRGTPVVVNVWASWCGPCRVEMPLLERAARRYRGQVVFLGVSSRDDRRPAEAFLRRYAITYPNVFDGSGAVRRRLQLRGFPTTYFFDRDGVLRSSVVGGVSEQTLAARVRASLGPSARSGR